MTSEKQPQTWPCMILCGGTSRRFGPNKMLANLAGQPVLAHTINRVMPQVSQVCLNGDTPEYENFGLPVFPDVISGKLGPLAGVLSAMMWAQDQSQAYVLSVSGDAPFIPLDWAVRMTNTVTGKNTIAIPRVARQSHQVCALWPTNLAGMLVDFLHEETSYKVRDFLATQNTQYVDFETSGGIDPFFNINTPEDLLQAEQLMLTG